MLYVNVFSLKAWWVAKRTSTTTGSHHIRLTTKYSALQRHVTALHEMYILFLWKFIKVFFSAMRHCIAPVLHIINDNVKLSEYRRIYIKNLI